MSKKAWVLVGGLIVIGVVYTLRDYRMWRHAELDKYGQGVATTIVLQPSLALTQVYSPSLGSFRAKFPENWKVVSTPKNPDLVSVSDTSGKVQMKITLSKTNQTLSDVADKFAVGVTRDREYLSSGHATFTILTWDAKPVVQKALTIKGDQLMTIEVTCEASFWTQYAQTFDSIYRSVIWR